VSASFGGVIRVSSSTPDERDTFSAAGDRDKIQ